MSGPREDTLSHWLAALLLSAACLALNSSIVRPSAAIQGLASTPYHNAPTSQPATAAVMMAR